MKTFLLALFMACALLRAQTTNLAPPPPQPPADANAATNAAEAAAAAAQEEALRQALHQTMQRDHPSPFAQRLAARPAQFAASNPPVTQIRPLQQPGPTGAPAGAATNVVPAASGPSAAAANPPGAPPPPAAAPGIPAAQPAPASTAAPAPAPATPAPPEENIPPGTIDFRQADLAQVLQIYAEMVNRTILRQANLPAAPIFLKTQTPLTKSEAIQALDAVLALNGIAMINVGEKFVKAVQVGTAGQEGAKFSNLTVEQLPDMGQYVTHVVQTRYLKPSELVPVLQPFAKIPNAILPIDTSQILVLRDFAENIKRMLEMINRVDVAVPSEFESEVIPIKYALASEIASALNSLSSGGGGTTVGGGGATGGARTTGGRTTGGYNRPGTPGYPGTTTSPFGQPQPNPAAPTPAPGGSTFTDRLQSIIRRASVSGEIQVLGQTKIISDERTNSLLIYASHEDMKTIKDIVAKLDVVLAQVLIEAVIIEVQLGPDNKSLGVTYLMHPQQSGDVTHFFAGGAGNVLTPGNFIQNGGTNMAGAFASGFNYLAHIDNDLDVVVTALQSGNRAKILQRPRIQTSHAVPASLFVGESRPYPVSSYYGGGSFGGYASIQQLQIGVTLEVTPLINVEGLVVMDIHQKIDSFEGNVSIQNVGDVPVTSSKEASAKVAVRDKDTIMLGGLIEDDKSKSTSGIPLLMDIPWLGSLFRQTSTSNTRKELIVLIRPTVLPTPEAAAHIARVEKANMPGVVAAEKELRKDEGHMKQQEMQYKDQ